MTHWWIKTTYVVLKRWEERLPGKVQLPGGGVRSCYIEFRYQLKGNSKRIKKDNWGRIQAFLMQGAKDKNSHLALRTFCISWITSLWEQKWVAKQFQPKFLSEWFMEVKWLKKWYPENLCPDTQLWLTLCNPMGCSLPGSSVHGILQAIILEWVAISFST